MRKGGTIPSYAIVRALCPGTPRSEIVKPRPHYGLIAVMLALAIAAVKLLAR